MPARIVVVHDDPGFVEETVEALTRAGWNTTGYVDPMVALTELEAAKNVDVLLTRLRFGPGKPHGISLALMTRVKRPRLKVLFTADPEFTEEAKRVGEVLPPSLDGAILTGVVERILGQPRQDFAQSQTS